MKKDLLILAEHRDNQLDSITLELLGKGRELADQSGGRLAVLLVGSELDHLISLLQNSGADLVISVMHPVLNKYQPELFTIAIAKAIKEFSPEIVLMGYTYMGMELGPALAVRLGGSIVTNCSELVLENDELKAIRPMFSGTLLTKVQVTGPMPYIASMEKGIFSREPLPSRNAAMQSISVNYDAYSPRSRILRTMAIDTGGIDITKARILVSAGRGVGGADKLTLIRQLAEALGGEMACSRPVADMGWMPFAHQVGISANTVNPDVYIACGISGASQHVTAMRGAGLIIAINKDANAPIFRVADYGVIGDLFDVIPALIEKAEK